METILVCVLTANVLTGRDDHYFPLFQLFLRLFCHLYYFQHDLSS